jgi:hypothetical protein
VSSSLTQLRVCLGLFWMCVDAQHGRQHARKCAQQRLRARSATWRSGEPTGRWRGNGRATAHHHSTSTFQRPRAPSQQSERLQTQQKYRALVVRRILSESERSGAQIPLDLTKTMVGLLKTAKVHVGTSGSKKRGCQWGLVPLSRPCHVGGRPRSQVTWQGPGERA